MNFISITQSNLKELQSYLMLNWNVIMARICAEGEETEICTLTVPLQAVSSNKPVKFHSTHLVDNMAQILQKNKHIFLLKLLKAISAFSEMQKIFSVYLT